MKIYVAGHQGMVGSAICRKIDQDPDLSWVGVSRSKLDLTDRNEVFDFVGSGSFDAVVIAAAKVGGIGANSEFPVNFLSENLQIQTNLMDAASAAQVSRLIFLGSSCIYPKFSPQPITEESLLRGELEPTNEHYAIAKISGLKLVDAYRKQYGLDWISLMPTNLYGTGDNYDLETSHVVPALIRKFVEARNAEQNSVTLWGSGTPKREFLHVDDLAAAIIHCLRNYSGEVPLNVGSGEEVSIEQLASLISDIVGFSGFIEWDKNRPDGTPRKLLDSSRLRKLGWRPEIPLEDGIERTVKELGWDPTL